MVLGTEVRPTAFTVFPMTANPLLHDFQAIMNRITSFKEHARAYYHDVMMSALACPRCSGHLAVTGASQAVCQQCHTMTDPTVTFQHSNCCCVNLIKKRTHYACSRCGRTTASRFLFDEALFDALYFRGAMAESRERKRRTREERRILLAQSRSDELTLSEPPDIALIPGLADALANFLEHTAARSNDHTPIRPPFCMDTYRQIILGSVGTAVAHFDAIPAIEEDSRLDRARRFTTLIFMQHDREVWLQQYDKQILVMPYEAHN